MSKMPSMPMDQANALVPLVLFGFIFVFLLLFAFLPPRRAAIASFLSAWLFMPVASYEIEGFPEYSKLFATCFGILLAVVIFDFKRLIMFRPKWHDLPIILWCLTPTASSIYNGLGVYDGFSESLSQTILWGVPYLIGRIYFTNWKELREFAIGIIISGLVYASFIIIEMRLSPQLHNWVYGAYQHKFDQTLRYGMWRPMVFMQHGLMLAFWVMTVTLLSLWMWRSNSIEYIPVPFTKKRLPFKYVAIFFLILTVLCVSANAWLWMMGGLAALLISDWLKRPIVILLMMLVIPGYIALNGLSVWPTELTIDFATGIFGEERAQSLEYRYYNEEMLTARARENWLFGWGGWGRQIPRPEWGSPAIPDSQWVIIFGKFGVWGLSVLLLLVFAPVLTFIFRYPPWIWRHPNIAPAAVMSIILVLYMYDFMLNAMVNPVFMVSAGGLMGALANLPSRSPQFLRSAGGLAPATGD